MGTKNPMFCEKCSAELRETKRIWKYDQDTGEPIIETRRLCPRALSFYINFGHTATYNLFGYWDEPSEAY